MDVCSGSPHGESGAWGLPYGLSVTPWGPQSPLTSSQELGKEHTGCHMGGFHGPDLEIVSITFIHVPLAGIVTWSHLTSREAGKCN